MKETLDLMNEVCKVAFILYAWVTMIRLNAFISNYEKKGRC